jgi:uncharacterized RDD family membrane protein YckC
MESTPPPETEPAEQVQTGILPAGEAIHAGFWRRWAAWVGDASVLLLLAFISLPIVDLMLRDQDWGGVMFVAGVVVIPTLYFALMERSPWQATPGKRVMGIKVVDGYGRSIGFWRAAVRFAPLWGILIAFSFFIENDSDAILIALVGLLFMMSGWTARKQTLIDKLAGTFVVFNTVQPGQPLPAKRPPLPWYWQAINIASCLALALVWIVAIGMPDERDYRSRANVAEMLGATDSIKQEIDSAGCHPGSRPAPNPKIAAVEVSDAGSGRCTITATLGQFQDKVAALNGGKLNLTREENGDWTCSSDLPNKYLPGMCRRDRGQRH